MQLYEFPPTRSIRARWVLQELGVPFEPILVDLGRYEHKAPAFLKINPAGKVPALVDGDVVLTESVAIAVYLGEKFPEKEFVPKDLAQRAQMNRWLLFAATELEQPLWRHAKHTNLYPEAERIPADLALAEREFRESAAVLEAHLAGRTFLVGDRVSVADFVMAYTLDWADMLGWLDASPQARAYLERMYARPKAAMRIRDALRSVGLAPEA
jgi:glutathione S-transferase